MVDDDDDFATAVRLTRTMMGVMTMMTMTTKRMTTMKAKPFCK